MRVTCSAPTRIDLAGGTIDIWPLYLFHDRAQTINAAIGLRATCTIVSRDDDRIVLVSHDTGERVEAPGPDALDVDRLPLLARLVRFFGARGIELTTRSGSPMGAGLGGSSALNVATASALAAWTHRDLGGEALLQVAMNLETQVLNVPAGVQDYRPALYGGVLAIELDVSGVRTVPLAVDLGDLSRRLVVAYTGASRNSGINNWDVFRRRIDGDPLVVAAFNGIRDAAAGMRHALETGDWTAAAASLAAEWNHRKCLGAGVTTPAIDRMLAGAAAHGAGAGKVCGAGGGGCLFCLVDPAKKAEVAHALADLGAMVLPIDIERDGVRLQRE